MDEEIRAWLETALRTHRVAGKTRVNLAKHLGVNRSVVSQILRGRRKIQLSELPLLIEFFGEGLSVEILDKFNMLPRELVAVVPLGKGLHVLELSPHNLQVEQIIVRQMS